MDLMEMMKNLGGDGWAPYSSAENMIADAKRASERFLNREECPFKVGDIVTPKKNAGKKGRGLPNVVVTTYDVKELEDEPGSPVKLADMCVVVSVDGGRRDLAFDMDSANFEPFDSSKCDKDE